MVVFCWPCSGGLSWQMFLASAVTDNLKRFRFDSQYLHEYTGNVSVSRLVRFGSPKKIGHNLVTVCTKKQQWARMVTNSAPKPLSALQYNWRRAVETGGLEISLRRFAN